MDLAHPAERYQQFLSRWPTAAQARAFKPKLGELEQEVREGLDSIGLYSDDRMAMAFQNDRVQLLLQQKRFQDAVDVGRAALAISPGHFPIQNNIGTCLLYMGSIEEAATVEFGACADDF